MIINDHYLKFAKILPQCVTGKISDFAFLIFTPIVLAFLFRISTRRGLLICYFFPGFFLAAIDLSPGFSGLVEQVFQFMHLSIVLWPDPTDLMALTVLPVTYLYLFEYHNIRTFKINLSKFNNYHIQRIFGYILIVFAIITCVNTSPRRQNSHEPVYIKWQDFRNSVKITAPQQIESQGKIYLKDNYLFINEPNKGIHIFNVSKKEKPIAVKFIKIYGNVDIAVKTNTLYADSYTDLLIFNITDPVNPIFIKRINDQFEYDPLQSAPQDAEIYDIDDSGSKGVIIKWIGK